MRRLLEGLAAWQSIHFPFDPSHQQLEIPPRLGLQRGSLQQHARMEARHDLSRFLALMVKAMQTPTLLQRAQLAAADPAALVSTLRTPANVPVLTVVSRPGGGESFALTSALPPLEEEDEQPAYVRPPIMDERTFAALFIR